MQRTEADYEMRDEYDFSKGVKGVFLQRFEDLHLVSVAPELREAFPDSAAVNAALREVLERRRLEAKTAVALASASEAA